jgi:segregation and condensation protein A
VLELNIFDLVEAFHHIVSSIGDEKLLEIDVDKMSLSEKINEIIDILTEKGNQSFTELLGAQMNRRIVVYTFLAILELMRQKMIKVYQTASFGVIRVCLAVES